MPSRRARGASRLPSVAGASSPAGVSSSRAPRRAPRREDRPAALPGVASSSGERRPACRPSRALPASSGAAQRPGLGSPLLGARHLRLARVTVDGGDGEEVSARDDRGGRARVRRDESASGTRAATCEARGRVGRGAGRVTARPVGWATATVTKGARQIRVPRGLLREIRAGRERGKFGDAPRGVVRTVRRGLPERGRRGHRRWTLRARSPQPMRGATCPASGKIIPPGASARRSTSGSDCAG